MAAISIPPLPDDPALKNWIDSLLSEVDALREQVRLLTQKRFGASSEKSSPDQYGLFNEAEQNLPENTDAIETAEVPAHQRKKAGRRPLPAHLSRIREEHGLPEDEKVFSCCGNQNLHRIGEEVSELLDIMPAKIQVIQHVRPKYACRACEGAEEAG